MHLFYPHTCCGCGSDVIGRHSLICLKCKITLPHTDFHLMPGNPVEKIFYGRYPVNAAHASFYFSKGQTIQKLMHVLKYDNNRPVGHYLGKLLGEELLISGRFTQIDYLVPLPMFAAKEFKRGYNQAEIIANGVSEAMNVPVLNKTVTRQHATETQTKKHRTERWDNVVSSFAVKNIPVLQGKHILLVDDVLTTGATLDACCQCLRQVAGLQISIATLATASK